MKTVSHNQPPCLGVSLRLGVGDRFWRSVFDGIAVALVLVLVIAVGGGPVVAQEANNAALPPGVGQQETPAEPEANIIAIRFGDHLTKYRVVLELSAEPEFEILYSDNPQAVWIDFPLLASEIRAADDGIGFIKSYEIVRRSDGGTRIELGLSRPARAGQVFYLPATPSTPPRFVLDLSGTTEADFASLVALSSTSDPQDDVETARAPKDDPVAEIIQSASLVAPSAPVEPEPDEIEEAVTPPEAAPDQIEPPAEPASVPVPPLKPPLPALPVVVLDPGHGGYDPGAVSRSGVLEKDITIRAARMLRDLLAETGRYQVEMTRDTDTFLALRERVEFARDVNASLFLSLHADSINDPSVRGASVYTLSEVASDREAAALAARENRADALSGVSLGEQDDDMTVSILIDLAQRQSRSRSVQVANLLIGSLRTVQPLVRNTHRQAGFAVLTAPDVPSVLLELGYLSSDEDLEILRDQAQLRRLMIAVERAIENYFKSYGDGGN